MSQHARKLNKFFSVGTNRLYREKKNYVLSNFALVVSFVSGGSLLLTANNLKAFFFAHLSRRLTR